MICGVEDEVGEAGTGGGDGWASGSGVAGKQRHSWLGLRGDRFLSGDWLKLLWWDFFFGTGGSKRTHHLVSNSMTPAAHMSDGHIQIFLSHVRWRGGLVVIAVSFAWKWDPWPKWRNRPEKAAVPWLSFHSRHMTADVDQKHVCFYTWIYVYTHTKNKKNVCE